MRRNMAGLHCDSWCAEVTFDTGDKPFLDSFVYRENHLSWHQIINKTFFIHNQPHLNFLSRPTCLKGIVLKPWQHDIMSNLLFGMTDEYFNLPATHFLAPACVSFKLASWDCFNLLSHKKSRSQVFSVSFLETQWGLNSVTAYKMTCMLDACTWAL